MRHGEAVFVDSGAWIALALSRDPLHAQAREQWNLLHGAGAKLHTSIPVVIETFTFLDRNANRDVALTWRESIYKPGTVKILPCELRDLMAFPQVSPFPRITRGSQSTPTATQNSSLNSLDGTGEVAKDLARTMGASAASAASAGEAALAPASRASWRAKHH